MNHLTLAGHLGADPEVRFTSSGQKVTTLRVATRTRKGGKDDTIWWRVTVWGEQFDKMIPYLKKGSPIVAFGELDKPEIFTNREGKPQISMSMTAFNLSFSPFGRSSEGSSSSNMSGESKESEPSYAGTAEAGKGMSFSDDEVPF